MGAERHALRRFFRRKAGANRETAAKPFGEGRDVGRDARLLYGEKAARASDSRLHLVNDEQQAMAIAKPAQRLQKVPRERAHAAFALNRFDEHARRFGSYQRFDGGKIAERRGIEAFDLWTEALDIFWIAAGGERRERAPVKRALEGDEAVAMRLAFGRVKFARGLDRAFDRFRAGITEEDEIGESRIDEPARKAFGLRDLIEIGDVPGTPRRRKRVETRCGCAWPSELTATPAPKSR